DNAKALYDSLKNERPDLSRLRYGVFGLGDSTYFDTFNNGGKQFDEILAELGATRIGDRVEHNASGDVIPEDAGVEWAKAWVKQIEPVPAEAG
ncbi:MAG TPA: flavodoxin domain-containing protein, partial [Candidatus Cybelea sp.]|nr:flavodoxin domain-containing protein [Candidatus Cybelea sp.]